MVVLAIMIHEINGDFGDDDTVRQLIALFYDIDFYRYLLSFTLTVN